MSVFEANGQTTLNHKSKLNLSKNMLVLQYVSDMLCRLSYITE